MAHLLGGVASGAEFALLVEEADGGVQTGALRGGLQAVVGREPERHQLGGHLCLGLRLGPAGAEQSDGAPLAGRREASGRTEWRAPRCGIYLALCDVCAK